MIRRPPRATRTDTLFPYTTLFRSMNQPRMKRLRNLPSAPPVDGSFWNLKSTMLKMRSEEHTSELQSLMRISYAVFCLKKKRNQHNHFRTRTHISQTHN